MTPTPQLRSNPYVGPRAFQYGETLYGRDREEMELLNLLIAERIVLLYSPSGAGKTSLIQAALIPALEKEDFQVLPVMRVSLDPPPGLALSPGTNRYVLSLLLSLEEALLDTEQRPVAELARMELADYLEQREVAADTTPPVVLIFDQFEEILTVDPTDRAAKEAFFAQVGAALRPRHRWALFAMREEYPAGLDPYVRPIPTRFGTTFRLELLGEEAARLTMQQPAKETGVEFTDAAARKLVNDLRRVRVQRPEGTTEEQPGLYVEPVQLQVVCHRLWEKLSADARVIDEADVEAVGDVNSALAGYYAERMAVIAQDTGVRERTLREWFDRHLITEQGIRGQVLQGRERSQGLDNHAIGRLVDTHLVRAEKRRGAIWFELSHDRLIEPVRKNNTDWYQANLSTLQRQADLWESQGRQDGLLLRDAPLEEAESWAADHHDELTPTESDFLAACQEARTRARREQRNNRLIRGLAIAATSVMLVALYFFIQTRKWAMNAEERRVEAERVGNVSLAQALAAHAPLQQDQSKQDERGALLARQAYLFHQRNQGQVLNQIDNVLRTVLSTPYFSRILRGHEGDVRSVALSPDGKLLAAGSEDYTVRLWEVGNPNAVPISLLLGRAWATSIAFSPDGHLLAAGGLDGAVRLWKVGKLEVAPTVLHGPRYEIKSIAFSPDGKLLAAGGERDTIQPWEVGKPDAAPTVLSGHKGRVYSVAFSPDGKLLASGGEDSTIRLWEVGKPEATPTVLRNHEGWVNAVAFSPDGKFLASGSADRTIRLWEVDKPGSIPIILGGHERSIHSVAFSPDGKFLAAGSEDGTIRLFEVGRPSVAPLTLRDHEAEVNAVAFSPDGKLLAAGGGRTLLIWVARTETLAAMVCEKVRRNLTLEEWRQFMGADLPYEQTCPNLPIHPSFFTIGTELVEAGNVDGTFALFQKSLRLDPQLVLSAQAEAKKWAVSALMEQGKKLVRAGNVDGAITSLQKALALDSRLRLDSGAEAKKWVASALVEWGEELVMLWKVKEALAAYEKAQTLDPALEISAESWKGLCWNGSLLGYAADFMQACNQAVALAPGSVSMRDSRGLARALIGNTQEAIEDFQAFVTQTHDEELRAQRQRWINALRTGENPFTPQVLESLPSW